MQRPLDVRPEGYALSPATNAAMVTAYVAATTAGSDQPIFPRVFGNVINGLLFMVGLNMVVDIMQSARRFFFLCTLGGGICMCFYIGNGMSHSGVRDLLWMFPYGFMNSLVLWSLNAPKGYRARVMSYRGK